MSAQPDGFVRFLAICGQLRSQGARRAYTYLRTSVAALRKCSVYCGTDENAFARNRVKLDGQLQVCTTSPQ